MSEEVEVTVRICRSTSSSSESLSSGRAGEREGGGAGVAEAADSWLDAMGREGDGSGLFPHRLSMDQVKIYFFAIFYQVQASHNFLIGPLKITKVVQRF